MVRDAKFRAKNNFWTSTGYYIEQREKISDAI